MFHAFFLLLSSPLTVYDILITCLSYCLGIHGSVQNCINSSYVQFFVLKCENNFLIDHYIILSFFCQKSTVLSFRFIIFTVWTINAADRIRLNAFEMDTLKQLHSL